MHDPQPLHPPELAALTGDEHFGNGKTVADFWRWTMGDLRMNTTRGFLVEYLVACAVDSKDRHRVEWAPFDVQAGDGTRLEVKATGRLQSWTSPPVTSPSWSFGSVNAARIWDDQAGAYTDVDPWNRVDAWVFALHTCSVPADYNPLDLRQWEFRAVPHRALVNLRQKSARVSTIEALSTGPVAYEGLADAVTRAREANRAIVRGDR